MSPTSEFSEVRDIFYKRGQSFLNLLLRLMKVSYLVTYEGVLLDYDSNSRAYRVFNVTTGCVETMRDTVFDETNGSQKVQVNIDLVDDEEAPCDALQIMTIDDVRPQDPSNQPQEISPNDTTPPAQAFDQDNHEEYVKPNDQGQEESNDQEGDEDNGDKEKAPPHPRVCQNI
jgi:hypothetical protein